jgi:hypothetical protein
MRVRPISASLAVLVLVAGVAAAPAGAREPATTASRPVSGFTRIVLEAPLEVEVKEGAPFAVSVTVEGDPEDRVQTRVRGDALVVTWGGPSGPRGAAKVTVALPELKGLTVNGSGDVRIAAARLERDVALEVNGSGNVAWDGKAGALVARARGSGEYALRGEAKRLEATVEGSGEVKARALTVRDAILRTHGSGDIEVTVRGGALRAATEGSGDIRWWGDAKVEEARSSGSGDVRHE